MYHFLVLVCAQVGDICFSHSMYSMLGDKCFSVFNFIQLAITLSNIKDLYLCEYLKNATILVGYLNLMA